ncbi:hypothetical protein FA95DRAFT_1665594 [Auriscalpium vulgare]|uniref:Uncharacterized protein n=1 Tax=Auriscalpium vulgare TaxID=40419 RepID=A0ACB8R3J8_9AGAM|nr:hypothetical protein FA95DRAFT_1665594 [Auriscalpium vulgare]
MPCWLLVSFTILLFLVLFLAEQDVQENSWHPFESRVAFDFAYHHFADNQSSVRRINEALDIWTACLLRHGDAAPWRTAKQMYATIDDIQNGDAPWTTVSLKYRGPLPAGTPPKWMTQTYDLCLRDTRVVLQNQLKSPEFRGKDQVNYVPYRQFDEGGKRVYSNFMSGDWAYTQADMIATDPDNHGAMFVPIIAGSDKTTCSVATGHQEYHPVYMSPGVLTNTARRAHGNSVLPVAFLPIPKVSKRHRKKPAYMKFCRQMYHSCLSLVFRPLKPGMSVPEVVECSDGHYRRAIYGLGPYIADYPEQVWLSCVVQGWCPKCNAEPDNLDSDRARRRTRAKTEFLISAFDPGILWDDYGIRSDVAAFQPFTNDFPRADIHQLLSPDLLHQVIKGTFKDHIVTWINSYLEEQHGEARANQIIEDIDRRLASVPAFPGLRRFHDGRDFQQWTGDDSKALMKIYLPAIAGYVPDDMVKCLAAFLDFCYIARRNSINADSLANLNEALDRFHHHRQIFVETGVRDSLSLPRQHSLKHYPRSIPLFGSPNGLCSSITESKHIKAVKEPWRRSSRFEALAQMLITNQRLDKLAALRRSFQAKGMLEGTTSSYTAFVMAGNEPVATVVADADAEDDDDGAVSGPKVTAFVQLSQTRERRYPKYIADLAQHINQPRLPALIRKFLYDQIYPDADVSADNVALDDCPDFTGQVRVYHSAVASFYAPSDMCGAGGMRRERIRSHPNWRKQYARRDTVFIETAADVPGMLGMAIGRVFLLFSFVHEDREYACALVHWLVPVGRGPDGNTGMWVVRPEYEGNGSRSMAVVSLKCVARAAHLIGAFGSAVLPDNFHFSYSLDAFRSFYVNKYADHHAHEFLL